MRLILQNITNTNRKKLMTLEIYWFLWLAVPMLLLLMITIYIFANLLETNYQEIVIPKLVVSDQDLSPIALINLKKELRAEDLDKVISCYYNTPNAYKDSQLMPSDLLPHLCTHINVAFARVINKTIVLDDVQLKALPDIIKTKQKNPHLKILISVGGSSSDSGFSEMVVNHASRKVFIRSIKSFLRYNSLDGIDLDWEFPNLHNYRQGVEARERQHFSQLLREIRMEFIREKRNYILTVAVPAPETIVDISYDVDQLNLYVDYVNVMTYDYHYYTKFTPFTGFNSPLYARESESMYLATLNINYTANMYIRKGLDQNKLVLGIPTYGHTFKLVNVNNPNVGSPASGFGTLGGLGFVNYPDICRFVKNFSSEVIVKEDQAARVPYLYRNNEWVSYDNIESVMEKAKFIRDNNFRGAMIYSLNSDDYAGVCNHRVGNSVNFPLSHSIKNTLLYENDTVATL